MILKTHDGTYYKTDIIFESIEEASARNYQYLCTAIDGTEIYIKHFKNSIGFGIYIK